MTHAKPDLEAIDRAASGWFVRLEDDPDDAVLRDAFERWVAASPAHRSAWAETRQLSDLILRAQPDAGNIVPFRQRKRIGWRWPGVALAAGIAACLAWVMAPDIRIHLDAQAVAGTGEVRTVALGDGSRAWLAPGAAIDFDTDRGYRTVTLLRGTAYFDVARDPAHPFRVETPTARVTVLGTAFEVASADDTSVAVRRGRVEVADAKGQVLGRLHRGETLALHAPAAPIRAATRPDRIAPWIGGELIVNDRPIGDVIAALRTWYRGYIVVRGAGLATARVTGVYDLRDPDAALAALGHAHDVTIRQITPWLRIVTVG